MRPSYIRHKTRRTLLAAFGTGILFVFSVRSFADMEEIAPASAQQIMHALGPDSAGLTIPEDKIPDIFTLTASRLDEDKTRFMIEEPYKSGRWKGGKVVIEYARDLSYTMVSIYDRAGNRQRIYSVVNQPAAPSSTESAAASSGSSSPGNGWQSVSSAEPPAASPSAEPLVAVPASETTSTPTHHHHKTKSASTVTTVGTPLPATGNVSGSGVVGFQWDDAQGAYVPIHAAGTPAAAASPATASAPAQTVSTVSSAASTPAKKHHHGTSSDSGSSSTPAPVVVASVPSSAASVPTPLHPSPSASGNDEWVPQNTPPAAATSGTSGGTPVVSYVWDDKAGTYVPVQKSGSAASPAAAPDASTSGSTPKHKRHNASSSGSSSSTASTANSAPAASASSSAGTSAASVNDVPSTEDLLTSNSSAGASGTAVASNSGGSSAALDSSVPPPAPSKHKKSSVSASNSSSSSAATPPPASSNASNGYVPITSVNAASGGSPAAAASVGSDSEFTLRSQPGGGVPSTEDLLASGPSGGQSGSSASSSDTSSSHRKHKAPPPALPADVTAAAASMDAQSAAASGDASAGASAVGATGPDTTGADAWSPKKVAKPAVPEVVVPDSQKPIQVAMIPKPQPTPDASIESLMKIAQAGKNSGTNEADTWSPKAGAAPANPDASLNAQLEQARMNENKKVAAPVVKIRRDVNNPEQGVLPANSFEKFSGPRYGRHWEYERRLHLEKHPHAPVKDYDFYVDEVDRKKEIHNVYYYKHLSGQSIPKLVAVERHTHVTFLSNYDVDQEDKGKTSTYD